MTRYAATHPDGTQTFHESAEPVTHAVILSPAEIGRVVSHIEESMADAKMHVKRLHAVSKSPIVTAEVLDSGMVIMTLANSSTPQDIALRIMFTDKSTMQGEAELHANAREMYRTNMAILQDGRARLQALHAGTEAREGYTVIAWGTRKLKRQVWNTQNFADEGRKLTVVQVSIVAEREVAALTEHQLMLAVA